jgi:hypothetical protein
MKTSLQVIFAAIFIAQAFCVLNVNAKESQAIDINQIVACGDCK